MIFPYGQTKGDIKLVHRQEVRSLEDLIHCFYWYVFMHTAVWYARLIWHIREEDWSQKKTNPTAFYASSSFSLPLPPKCRRWCLASDPLIVYPLSCACALKQPFLRGGCVKKREKKATFADKRSGVPMTRVVVGARGGARLEYWYACLVMWLYLTGAVVGEGYVASALV